MGALEILFIIIIVIITIITIITIIIIIIITHVLEARGGNEDLHSPGVDGSDEHVVGVGETGLCGDVDHIPSERRPVQQVKGHQHALFGFLNLQKEKSVNRISTGTG